MKGSMSDLYVILFFFFFAQSERLVERVQGCLGLNAAEVAVELGLAQSRGI